MKILFIGDPHLRINRFQLAKDLFAWIHRCIEEHKPDLVVNLGDTFHDHAVLRSELLEEFRQHVLTVTKEYGTEYVYVLGNHDQYRPKDAKYHALQNFREISGLTIIESVTELHGMTFVPFLPEFTEFPLETKPICVAHQTFIGADYGYKREDVGVNADAVSADYIISGHIHKKQEFGKVVYPGIPYAQNINDVDQHKAILLFDTSTYKKQWLDSPFPVWRSLSFSFDSENNLDSLVKLLKEKLNSKDHFVLDLHGPKAEIDAALRSKKYSKATDGHSVLPRMHATDKNKQQIKIQSKTAKTILSEFVDVVYKGSVPKNELSAKVQEIYKEVADSQS